MYTSLLPSPEHLKADFSWVVQVKMCVFLFSHWPQKAVQSLDVYFNWRTIFQSHVSLWSTTSFSKLALPIGFLGLKCERWHNAFFESYKQIQTFARVLAVCASRHWKLLTANRSTSVAKQLEIEKRKCGKPPVCVKLADFTQKNKESCCSRPKMCSSNSKYNVFDSTKQVVT